ncbi:hypothetical protein HSX11_25485 [Oxalobacteraceae bacterium]|nr:hypothetical protein [Oxalobacteraceae bacterium]
MHKCGQLTVLAALLTAGLQACAQAPAKAIEDVEPEVTAQVRDMVGQLSSGQSPAARMTERASAAATGDALAGMQALLKSCTKPPALVLQQRSTKGEDRRYDYRVDCGAAPLQLHVEFNKAARVNVLTLNRLE